MVDVGCEIAVCWEIFRVEIVSKLEYSALCDLQVLEGASVSSPRFIYLRVGFNNIAKKIMNAVRRMYSQSKN